jgi:hypothetical protein
VRLSAVPLLAQARAVLVEVVACELVVEVAGYDRAEGRRSRIGRDEPVDQRRPAKAPRRGPGARQVPPDVGVVNLMVGSASAKWALIAPIMVPMLMQLGISPDLTQAAYRVGDSTTNIITPLMPYFPLVVVFCQKYVKKTGIGTLVSMMLPFSIFFLIVWTIFLLVYWKVGYPLGLQATYEYIMVK